MTAPTSDRAQSEGDRRRTVRFIAGHLMNKRWHAAAECMLEAAHNEANALITERLGGGERETVRCEQVHKSPYECIYFTAWSRVCDALRKIDEDWALHGAAIDKAPEMIRTLAQTAKDATARAEAAEAANMELDKERRSSDQSARDLRENNATLRAELDAINTKTEHDQALMDTQAKLIVDLETELDAIKGAQVPYRWTVVVKDRMSFTFTSLGSAQTWANGEGGEVIPLYRHPAPTLPVVGACVVRKDGRVIEWSSTYEDADGAARNALHYVRSTGDGTAHQLLLGAPFTPNADGAK